MGKSPEWLLEYKEDVFSQTGEDGIIKKILEIIPEKDRWCVEFGAWDGKHLCNTRNLIENAGYSAVLIEGSKSKFDDLKKNYSGNDKVTPVNAFVGFTEGDNLDGLLEKTAVPQDFDFLSIDVDGNDYHIWKALSKYQPKVVCVEFNHTIPTEVRFVQPANPKVNQGSSLLALADLGKEKGYELVSVLAFNAFFVLAEYFPLYEIEDNSPFRLRKNLDRVTYIFSGYDGKVFLDGCQRLPWHGFQIKESKVQLLPKFLQKFPSDYSPIESVMAQLCVNPLKYLKRTYLRWIK